MTRKKSVNENNLSVSLKRNLKLRKKQVSERDDNKIIGKRTNKIGQSRLFINKNIEKIYITGEKKLTGSVNISGAKNAALPLMALSLIINKDFNLYNVPDLADTRLMSNLLIDLGIEINWEKVI